MDLDGSFGANPETRDEIANGLSDKVALPYDRKQAGRTDDMIRNAFEFGFTPASRSRISAPPPDQLPLLNLAMEDYEQENAAVID